MYKKRNEIKELFHSIKDSSISFLSLKYWDSVTDVSFLRKSEVAA